MMKSLEIICIICATLVVIGILYVLFIILLRSALARSAAATARKKCDEYVKQICNQSIPKNKTPFRYVLTITGGTDAPDGMLPHMAFVAVIFGVNNVATCGGTIISEYFVMTAGHCVHNADQNQILVVLGGSVLTDGSTFEIDKIYVHPDYQFDNARTYASDIALLKLYKKVEFNWKMRPICLNTDFDSISTANMTVSGWGVDETGRSPRGLQVVDTYIDGRVWAECVLKYGEQPVSVMICAGHPTERKSACKGDSGGPLQIPLKDGCPNTYEQIGITSFSDQNCTTEEREPMLVMYTKVQLMIPWIVEIVWPN